jgi:hypothetical protein
MTKTTFLMEPKDGAFMTFSSREEVEEYIRTLRDEYNKKMDAAIEQRIAMDKREFNEQRAALRELIYKPHKNPFQFIEPRTLKYSDKYTKE